MIKLVSAILSSIFMFAATGAATQAETHVPEGEARWCDAYLRLNKKLGCEPDGYLVVFGKKYCDAYVKKNDKFELGTQKVLAAIRRCLVKDAVANDALTCENVETESIASHVKCYVASGFCRIPLSEQFKIGWIARSEITEATFLKTMVRTAKACDKL